jgi:hypothetical protein
MKSLSGIALLALSVWALPAAAVELSGAAPAPVVVQSPAQGCVPPGVSQTVLPNAAPGTIYSRPTVSSPPQGSGNQPASGVAPSAMAPPASPLLPPCGS